MDRSSSTERSPRIVPAILPRSRLVELYQEDTSASDARYRDELYGTFSG